eukprot:976969-Prorocentrum_minimum.AAC.1
MQALYERVGCFQRSFASFVREAYTVVRRFDDPLDVKDVALPTSLTQLNLGADSHRFESDRK